MKLFRYRKSSINTIIGLTKVKRQLRKVVGTSTLERYANLSRIKQRVKQKAGIYSPPMTIARQTSKGRFRSLFGLLQRFNRTLSIILLTFLFFTNFEMVFAHPGNTAADGCHYCRTNCDYWGVPWNERHCHGGSVDTVTPNQPVLQMMAGVQATNTFIPDDHGSFTVVFDWERPEGRQWSIAISKTKGADPGPQADTYSSKYEFHDVKPGTWYVNLKELLPDGYWTAVSYWAISVPVWTAPTSTPLPTITYSPVPENKTSSDDNSGALGLLAVAGIIGGGLWLRGKRKS